MKRAIVIGASSGIGRQVASLLIQRGWNVGIAARRLEPLNELKTMAPDRVFVKQIDVTSDDAETKLKELINELAELLVTALLAQYFCRMAEPREKKKKRADHYRYQRRWIYQDGWYSLSLFCQEYRRTYCSHHQRSMY